jgi:hypothetical protein
MRHRSPVAAMAVVVAGVGLEFVIHSHLQAFGRVAIGG